MNPNTDFAAMLEQSLAVLQNRGASAADCSAAAEQARLDELARKEREALAKKAAEAERKAKEKADALRAAAKNDWIDIDLARINPVGIKARMDGTPEEVVPCLREMHAKGKAVLGMKILGEGTFKTPEEQLASLKFVLALGCVDAFVIGFESIEQVDQMMERIETALKG